MSTGLGDEKLWLCPTLDDSADDLSGEGNNGTYNGGMGTTPDTGSGGVRAYLFDGSNDYIDTLSTTVHQNTLFTYAFWINASASASGTRGTMGSWETGPTRGPLAATLSGDNKLTWLYQSLGNSYNSAQLLKSTGDVYDSTWRHVVCEFDGNNNEVKIYIDGSLDSSKTASVPNTVNINVSLRIGTGSGGYTAGLMDDVRVYNRSLSQAEVTHLATSRGIEGTPFTGLGGEKVWLCPSLTEGTTDISGNGNNGTYVGGLSIVADTGSGGSYCFDHDAISKGVTLPADLGLTADDATISIWVYHSTVQANTTTWQIFGAYDGSFANSNPLLYKYNSVTAMSDKTTSPNQSPELIIETTSFSSWLHLCMTKESGVYKVYKNGVLTGTSAQFTGDLSFKTVIPWAIGKGNYNSFLGLSDDARIFNRAITQAEITHLATSRGILGNPSSPTGIYNPFRSIRFYSPRFGGGRSI